MATTIPNFITNTAGFAQYRRTYNALTTTANTTYTASPTNSALLYVAGPDGSLITRISSIPRATVTATQMQLFMSPDGGTTNYFYNSVLMAAYTMAQTTACTPTAFTQPDGSQLYDANPIPLGGQTAFYNTVSTTPTQGGTSQGSANAQTLPEAIGITSLVKGTVIDFEAGLTNTATATLTVGTSAATSLVRDYNGAALSAGDITTGFRYRVWYDSSYWRLVITPRLYIAQGVTLASGIVTTASGVDF
jgi:hypothetical protein